MRDRLFKFLFPNQYKQIERINELLKVNNSPDFRLSAPEGTYFRDVNVYLVTDFNGSAIGCQWVEIPYKEG